MICKATGWKNLYALCIKFSHYDFLDIVDERSCLYYRISSRFLDRSKLTVKSSETGFTYHN